MTGTHEGPMFGIEPTDTRVELPANRFISIAGGTLRETWTQSDMLGLLEQLGDIPSPSELLERILANPHTA